MSDEQRECIDQQILAAAEEAKQELKRVSIITYSLFGVSCTAFSVLAYASYKGWLPAESMKNLVLASLASLFAPLFYTIFNKRQKRAFAKISQI